MLVLILASLEVVMSDDIKENFPLEESANSLSLKKDKQNNKAKHDSKKKYKNSKKNRAPMVNANVCPKDSSIESTSTNNFPLKQVLKYVKPVPHHQQHQHQRPLASSISKFRIALNNDDLDICKRTAMQLHKIRESIVVDVALVNHLSMLAFTREQFQYEQQRKAYLLQEEYRQLEITKWLSTKSEEEREEYYNRTRQS